MEADAFNIYIDRLRNGKNQPIEGAFPPDFLGVDDEGLRFEKQVMVRGEAYIAEEDLVLHLAVKTEALLPCVMCSEMTPVEVSLESFYEAVPLSEVKGAIFDFRDCLREEILLQISHTVECQGGNCPARKEMTQYLKAETADEIEGYKPFADL